jgi:orotidine-5'-phosphate decarboxylase
LGVTVLTSLDETDLDRGGIGQSVQDYVRRLAGLALEAGLDGVVASPHEIELLRDDLGSDAVIVVPGIRPKGTAAGDQKRVMGPEEALARGADWLVIGRAISGADNPAAAAAAIARSLGAGERGQG